MRAARLVVVGALLLLLGSATCPARATDSDSARARALFEAAGELERDGRWSAAQDRLRAALRLRETPQLHFALGWALENDDKLLEARIAYETAARMSRERQGGDEARRLAIARLGDLETMTPILHVRLPFGTSSSARIIVDGAEIVRAGNVATTFVNPGSHVVRIERDASGAIEHMVYVGRGAERTVDVDTNVAVTTSDTMQNRHGPSAAAPAARVANRESAKASERDSIVPWLVLSGGIAFVAGGGALLISSAGDHDDARGAVGLTAGGVGLIGATVGALLLLRTLEPGAPRPKKRAATSAASVRGGAMATATISF